MKESIKQPDMAEAVRIHAAFLPNAFGPALCSIQDVVRAAASGWHKVYSEGNHCFMVHMNFSLPETAAMPVFTLRWGEGVPWLPYPDDFDEAEPYGFGFVKNSPRVEDVAYDYVYLSAPWNLSQTHLGNGTISVGEAVTFVQEKVADFSRGNVQIAPDVIVMVSPKKCRKAERENLSTKPHYHIQFHQLLSGIPILASAAVTLHASVKEKGSGYPIPTACVASREEYCMGTSFMVEEERVCEDVPLCPFPVMLKKWERLVLSGYVENIDKIRLGYTLFMDRKDEAKIWTVPSWVMRCVYHKEPQERKEGLSGWREIIFNAQTGDMLEVDSRDPDLAYCPPIRLG